MTWRVRTLGLAAAAAATACTEGAQSALDPRGVQADRIADLWWVFLAICTVVFVAVTIALVMAIFGRNRRIAADATHTDDRPAIRVIAGATVLTAIVLVVLIGYSAVVGRAISTVPGAADRPVIVDVIGHQWWWEIRYVDDIASRSFTTANELRVPVGRPVIVRGMSRDVIHSFWVPNLHGKVDFIPGRTNTIWFQADRPGVTRGQCAEFCGLQHAKMAITVIAEPSDEFDAWREASWNTLHTPATPLTQEGEQVFLRSQCSMCHTIRGSGARGTVAPDLTRLATRTTLGAGALPNTRGHLAGWILDPQRTKPGSFMPPTNLDPDELHALLAYLESLR